MPAYRIGVEMTGIAKLSHETVDGVEVVSVTGELDASNAAELSLELLGSISNQAHAVVVDLSNTTYIDSSGISLIFNVAEGVRTRRQRLRLVVVPRSFVAEVLTTVSLDDSVPIDAVLEDSLRALR